MILAIDPGKNKCGLAILDKKGNVQEIKIISREDISNSIPHYVAKYGVYTLVVGRSHFGKELEKELSRLDLRINIIYISEKYSTHEARKRYWKTNKPKGLMRLIPTSLRVPPEPVDNYAAVILGERFLSGL
jgi:RNase H-fold protein (predicted Holliday junction resolvase)